MKTKISVVFGITMFMFSFITFPLQHSKIVSLVEQIDDKDKWIEQERKNTEKALQLNSRAVWYIINDQSVSSLPDGKGEVVSLGNEKLLAMGNRFVIRHPDLNKKVIFLLNKSREGFYIVAGGWLNYEFVD